MSTRALLKPPRSKTITLKDVAERAGVAPMTVSRALNSPASVSPGLRTQIREAVAALGYVPNRFAGALASADSRVVSVIVPSLSNAVFIEVVAGIQDVLEDAGYQLLLGNTRYDQEHETALVSTLLGWSPAGMIVAGLKHVPRTTALLRNCGRPVVEMMEYGTRAIDMNVGLSHLKAGQAMGVHLVERGYRQIGFVGGKLGSDYRALQRFRGLDKALAQAGLPQRKPFAHEEESSAELGGDKLMEALRSDSSLDAIFFANDDLAIGALLRAQREGIDVPGQIAIAGFNGFPLGGLTRPSLTTIVSPRRRIGSTAATMLLARLREDESTPRRVDLGFELTAREST